MARNVIADPGPKVMYFVPHMPQRLEDASPFCMFTPGLLDSSELFMFASELPGDVREMYAKPSNVVHLRLRKLLTKHVIPIDIHRLTQAFGDNEIPSLFRIVLTASPEVADCVDRIVATDGFSFLHLSAIPGASRTDIQTFQKSDLRRYFVDQLGRVAGVKPEMAGYCRALVDSIPAEINPDSIRLPLRAAEHNVTAPNERVLRAFGYALSGNDPILPEGRKNAFQTHRYVKKIVESAKAVSVERKNNAASYGSDIIDNAFVFTAPSFHWTHKKNYRRMWGRLGERGEGSKAAQLAYKAAVRQDTYFDKIDSDREEEIFKTKEFQSITVSRARDLRCYTASITLYATQRMTPVMRLEPRVNNANGEAKMLCHSVRECGIHRVEQKQSRLAKSLSDRLTQLIDRKYLRLLDDLRSRERIQGLKLISDAPLEWMRVSDVPLGLLFDVSKIPTMPGNLLIGHCVAPPMRIAANQLTKILVLRTFADGDPLKYFVENAIRGFIKDDLVEKVNLKYVDVTSEDELVEAISVFDGAIVIFDGHGGFENTHGVGTIIVGGEPIEVWNLRSRCRLPPIVIFSACDTHPLDGSHGSCANAAFALGATTVLATSMPVDGRLAAIFIGRLIYRIVEFIPLAIRSREVMTWREVISGMLRMSYTTEVTRLLVECGEIDLSEAARDRILLVANHAINMRHGRWFDLYMDALEKESGQRRRELVKTVSRVASMVDAIKYVQLGNPEDIVIVDDAADGLVAAKMPDDGG